MAWGRSRRARALGLRKNLIDVSAPHGEGAFVIHADADGRFLDRLGRILDANGKTLGPIAGDFAAPVRGSKILSLERRFGRPLVWSPDGCLLSVGKPIDPLYAFTADLSDDGAELARVDGRNLEVLEVRTGTPRWTATLAADVADTVQFAPTSHTLLTRDAVVGVTVWEPSGQRRFSVSDTPARISEAEWAPDGRRLPTSGHSKSTQVWSLGPATRWASRSSIDPRA